MKKLIIAVSLAFLLLTCFADEKLSITALSYTNLVPTGSDKFKMMDIVLDGSELTNSRANLLNLSLDVPRELKFTLTTLTRGVPTPVPYTLLADAQGIRLLVPAVVEKGGTNLLEVWGASTDSIGTFSSVLAPVRQIQSTNFPIAIAPSGATIPVEIVGTTSTVTVTRGLKVSFYNLKYGQVYSLEKTQDLEEWIKEDTFWAFSSVFQKTIPISGPHLFYRLKGEGGADSFQLLSMDITELIYGVLEKE